MVQRVLDVPAFGSRRHEGPNEVLALPNLRYLMPSGLENGSAPSVYSFDSLTRSATDRSCSFRGSTVVLGTGPGEHVAEEIGKILHGIIEG